MAGVLRRSRDSSSESARNQEIRDRQIEDDLLEEFQNLNTNEDLKSIVCRILVNQNILNRKNNVNIEHDMGNYMYNFPQPNNTVSEEQIRNTVNDSLKTYEQGQIQKKLNFCIQNDSICAPEFSPYPREAKEKALTHKYVYQGKNKFAGEKHQSVSELLTHLNSVQTMLYMDEEEFKGFLLQNTTGNVFETCRNEFRAGSDVATIYNLLQVIYNKEMSPEEARGRLAVYKATKKDTMYTAFATVRQLCSSSIDPWVEPAMKREMLAHDSIRYFTRCLPPYSQTQVDLRYNEWKQTIAGIPKPTDFFRSLNPLKAIIDRDIATNGASVFSPGRRYHTHALDMETEKFSGFQDLESFYRDRENNIQEEQYGYPRINTFAISRNRERTNGRKPPKTFKYRGANMRTTPSTNPNRMPLGRPNRSLANIRSNFRASGSKYCSLCGNTSHNASDRCFRMRNDQNKVIDVTPVQKACDMCKTQLGKELFHPEKFCFLRDALKRFRSKSNNSQ
jgi:predicted transcriptional regulator